MDNYKLILKVKDRLISLQNTNKLDKSVWIRFEEYSGSTNNFIQEVINEGLKARISGECVVIEL